ncbi:unnamed protein product [Rotaria sordida]|uniref:Uncharacterized protein n=1 Tax=Rotaria sordida TaxID=392033 RepID=A0A814SSG8_9BILA|nr:unnamed protein product [Rotaria sordida]CAF1292747.1 unnamed protein product [Rotaria sordida]CAF3627434.1 unnamed protein product [Rotaria sordida]
MSQICAITSCNRLARALCHCCQKNVCIIHLNEHNNLLNNQLYPLIDNINILDNRLQTINIQKIINDYREKLEQWCVDSHKKIDEFFKEKCQELDRLVIDKIDEQKEEIYQLQSKITELIHEQQVTHQDIKELTSIIDHLEREINNIEQKYIQIFTQPLILDHNLISIKGNNEDQYDLSILSSVYKVINHPDGSYVALANNKQNLLIHQTPNLCLVNQDLEILKRIPWRHGIIYDICWSVTLNRFIILHQKHLFFLDENTMSIEKVQTIEKRKWLSCTCTDKFLFLSTNEWGSSITKIKFTSTKKLDNQWQSPNICKPDEYIDIITSNKKNLAIIIRNNTNKTIRLELRSSETLDCMWSLLLDILWNRNKPFHCCPFINEDWLVADYETGRLLHITKTGKIKSTIPYNTIPYCVTMFGSNTLVVSAKDGIHFHNLNYKKTYTIFVL